MYEIKIDRNSIRKNKTAGNKMYQYASGREEITTTVVAQTGFWPERWTKFTFVNQLLIGQEEVDIPEDRSHVHLSIDRRQDISTLYSLSGEPSHFYKYENTNVKCESCGEIFGNNLLEEDGDEDADGNYYHSETICPKCHCWNCCEVKYEKLDDIPKEVLDNAPFV